MFQSYTRQLLLVSVVMELENENSFQSNSNRTDLLLGLLIGLKSMGFVLVALRLLAKR